MVKIIKGGNNLETILGNNRCCRQHIVFTLRLIHIPVNFHEDIPKDYRVFFTLFAFVNCDSLFVIYFVVICTLIMDLFICNATRIASHRKCIFCMPHRLVLKCALFVLRWRTGKVFCTDKNVLLRDVDRVDSFNRC